MRTRTTLAFAALLAACGSDAEAPAPSGPPEAGPIPESWVAPRVEEARSRMAETEAGRLLWSAIEAHGGLEPWLSKGTVSFTFDYRPLGDGARRHTRSDIDLWRARARQEELGEGADATLGWDGEVAWITPDADAFPSPARFWATTPYYFIGIPFVLADPGTRYERLDDAELDGVTHQVVKVGYEDGTGDSPDDYYVLYLHPQTHRVSAIRYIVAYPGFFPDGGHSPEKLMRYEDLREIDGLWMAHRFRTHRFDVETQAVGELVTEVSAGDYRFGQTWPASHFTPPDGAETSSEIEARN